MLHPKTLVLMKLPLTGHEDLTLERKASLQSHFWEHSLSTGWDKGRVKGLKV